MTCDTHIAVWSTVAYVKCGHVTANGPADWPGRLGYKTCVGKFHNRGRSTGTWMLTVQPALVLPALCRNKVVGHGIA